MDWLDKIAPKVALALAGPFAGLAVEAMGEAFGWDDAGDKAERVQAIISGEQQLTGADVLALKQAEAALTVRLRELGVDLERIAAADRDSARARQVGMRDWTPNLLGLLILGATFWLEGYVLLHGYPDTMPGEVVGRILGTLDAASLTVLAYFFGSSAGSLLKTHLMGEAGR